MASYVAARFDTAMETVSKKSWLRLSPGRLVSGLLLAVCFLWLSEQFQWFAFNHLKGWTVLIAVAAVATVMILILFWWVASLHFHWRFQFGIRSLLVLAVVSSITASWWPQNVDGAQRQAKYGPGHGGA